LEAEYDRIVKRSGIPLGKKGEAFEYRPFMGLQSEILSKFCAHPNLVNIALDLVSPTVRLYHEQGINKPPHATTLLPWHQDNGYTPTIPEQYISCWLALDDAGPENGGLYLIPGSHKNGTLDHHRGGTGYFMVGYEGDEEGVPAYVKRGELLVFSSLMLHRSGVNSTDDKNRRAWIIQYCHGDSIHMVTKEAFDDRPLVAIDGEILDTPRRDKPLNFNIGKHVSAAMKKEKRAAKN